MKKLIIINGTMGVGKSTVCNILLNTLKPSVYLDGDWCWNMNPFIVSEENKTMVINNIRYLLKSYLNNSEYKYIIFCWVIHQENIFNEILQEFNDLDFQLYKITLLCSEMALKNRLSLDVRNGVRSESVIERSLQRIELYKNMDTIKIDVSEITSQETAEIIIGIIK